MCIVGTAKPVKGLAGNVLTVSLSRFIASRFMGRRRSHLVSTGTLVLCCPKSQHRNNVPLAPCLESPFSRQKWRFKPSNRRFLPFFIQYSRSLLSKMGFSLDSTRRGQALDDLLISRKERSKPLILHAGQVFLASPKPGHWPPRFWTAF